MAFSAVEPRECFCRDFLPNQEREGVQERPGGYRRRERGQEAKEQELGQEVVQEHTHF